MYIEVCIYVAQTYTLNVVSGEAEDADIRPTLNMLYCVP